MTLHLLECYVCAFLRPICVWQSWLDSTCRCFRDTWECLNKTYILRLRLLFHPKNGIQWILFRPIAHSTVFHLTCNRLFQSWMWNSLPFKESVRNVQRICFVSLLYLVIANCCVSFLSSFLLISFGRSLSLLTASMKKKFVKCGFVDAWSCTQIHLIRGVRQFTA